MGANKHRWSNIMSSNGSAKEETDGSADPSLGGESLHGRAHGDPGVALGPRALLRPRVPGRRRLHQAWVVGVGVLRSGWLGGGTGVRGKEFFTTRRMLSGG